jgi:hypothetical protein
VGTELGGGKGEAELGGGEAEAESLDWQGMRQRRW